MIPIGLETSFRPSPVTSRSSDLTISFATSPVTSTARPTAGHGVRAFEAEAELVPVVDELAATFAELEFLTGAKHGDRISPARLRRWSRRSRLAWTRLPLIATISVARSAARLPVRATRHPLRAPGAMVATVCVASPATVMKRNVKIADNTHSRSGARAITTRLFATSPPSSTHRGQAHPSSVETPSRPTLGQAGSSRGGRRRGRRARTGRPGGRLRRVCA